ncbi:hypothetical protein VCHA53O466_50202 [Vibrio chagasii]|nr:hypothetical protein VCHA53O466_50202 [Vibrio chagasii]
MKYRVNKTEGFMLAEAILASVMIGAAILGKVQLDARSDKVTSEREFGREISEVLTAMDRRILLDGLLADSSDIWSGSESNTYDSVMWLKSELIAYKNPDCGQSSGWKPSNELNDEVSLISCNQLSENGLPFGLTMTTERSSLVGDSRVFRDWEIMLKFKDENQFEPNTLFNIMESAKRHSNTRLMGVHRYKLVDVRSDAELLPTGCVMASSNCAIKATFESNYAGIAEDPYLRVDGSNIMRNGLHFGTKAAPAQCFRNIRDSGMTRRMEVPCGINLTSETQSSPDEVSVDAHTLSAQNLVFSDYQDSSGARMSSASVSCTDIDGYDIPCGVSSLQEAGSVAVRAHINSIVADNFMRLNNNGIKFNVDASGNITNSGTLVTEGHATLMAGLKVFGGADIEGATTLDGLTVKEDAEFKKKLGVVGLFEAKGGLSSTGNSTLGVTNVTGKLTANSAVDVGGLLTISNNLRMNRVVTVGTQSCSAAEEGQFARSSVGGMAQCQSLKWTATDSSLIERVVNTSGTYTYTSGDKGVSDFVYVTFDGGSGMHYLRSSGADQTFSISRIVRVPDNTGNTSGTCSRDANIACTIRVGKNSSSGCAAKAETFTTQKIVYGSYGSWSCTSSGSRSVTAPAKSLRSVLFF